MTDFVDRRTFLGLSAGALAATDAAAIAGAQVKLGRVHPPLVDPADPAIRADMERVKVGDRSIDAYVAHPRGAGRDTPSVVMTMHIWGVDTSMRDAARRLAKAGYAAIVPNLFQLNDAQPPSGDGATDYRVFGEFSQKLDAAQIDAALQAAAADIHGAFPQGKTGIGGFCMGGAIALRTAVKHPQTYAAAAIFYGKVEGVDPKSMAVPMVGSYGAKDPSIPADGVRAFAGALTVPHDIKVYDDAAHAFFDDQRSSYVADAAADAWSRTIAFLSKYLGGPARMT